MKGFVLGVTVTLALLAATISFAKIDERALLQAILPQMVVQIEQDVPVTAYLQMPSASGQGITITLPLTLAVDLRIGLSGPLSMTMDVVETPGLTVTTTLPPEPTPSPLIGLDRTDAESVANAVLQLYRSKDLAGLGELSTDGNQETIADLAKLGPASSRYESIFSGWRWDVVLLWNGGIEEVRYHHFERPSEESFEAHAKFGELSSSEIATVVLKWENEQWAFDDINSPDSSSFEQGIEDFSLDPNDY